MADIQDWYWSIPPITRSWFSLSVIFPLLGRIGLVNPYYLIMSTDFFSKLHLWRPLTATFFYPIGPGTGFHYLINLYFLYNYSKNLETGEFLGKPADYLFMLIFNWAALVLLGVFMNLYLFMDPLILSVLYLWCQLNKDVIVTFWFGTKFKAMYLPWVLLGFNMLLGGGGFHELLGIVVGHLYYYIKYVYPRDHGTQLIDTPTILHNYLPNYTPIRSTGGTLNSFPTASFVRNRRNQSTDSGTSGSGYNWGRSGHVLGGR